MASEKLSYNNEELMRTEGSKSKNKHISDILCILVLINLDNPLVFASMYDS